MTDALVRKGRGAWPYDGAGGTLNASGTGPGRYYVLAKAGVPRVGQADGTGDVYAVRQAVKGIQALLLRAHYPVTVTGVYDPATDMAVRVYQSRVGIVSDGVFGPKTAARFFAPTVRAAYTQQGIDWRLGYGFVTNESAWDPGAVGYVDDSDLGLCQINGRAHPDMNTDERLNPETSLMWQANFVQALLARFKDQRVAIAGYNLGGGGAQQWVDAGMPALWVPPFDTSGRARDVKGYIDRIQASAAEAPAL